ncbi:MAG: AAA family ATPase [Muribaculaceae bacterium]|nr:AAA family ATPase [Muribaculaceae bacterium]
MDFSQFSDKARMAVQKAFSLTGNYQFREIEPEVMLVALYSVGKDLVTYVLNRVQVDRDVFLQTVSATLNQIARSTASEHPLSAELEHVLTRSEALARDNGSPVVSLEHILWAFAVEPGRVQRIMADFGITPQAMQQAVEAYRADDGHSDATHADEGHSDNAMLRKFTEDMNALAQEGKIQPAIGRDTVIRQMLEVLAQKNKCNPVLVGPPGTGKTAIVEGLVCRIVSGDVPDELKNLHIYALQVASLTAGASAQGQFEQRLKDIIAEASADRNIVLFIDEMHLLMGAGSGNLDAANILKPAMARDDIRIIGATTTDEYVQRVEKDQAFERRLQRINIDEPDIDTAITIVRGIKSRYEDYHRIKILDEAVVAAVMLSHRYITDHYLPDKAISLIDVAAARMRINRSSCPAELDDLRRTIRQKEIERESILRDGTDDADIPVLERDIANLRERENTLNAKWRNERRQLEQLDQARAYLEQLQQQREQAEQQQRYDTVVDLQAKIDNITQGVNHLMETINSDEDTLLKTALDENDIMQLVTEKTGIPVNKIKEDENGKLLAMEQTLCESVIGQDHAVKVVSDIVRRNRTGLGDPNRPIGSFLFLGTTGVGKTELCKALAAYLFNSRDMMVRIDMSEYQQEHSVSRLFGAPPGYVGYDQGGQLTEAVRRKPYSVVLLDEIEKAHPKVFETLLQVLDDGRMTDGQGRTVNFKNTIIIMTSNFKADAILQAQQAAGNHEALIAQVQQQVVQGLRQRMSPEFVNRIDEIVIFDPLSEESIRRIVRMQVDAKVAMLANNGLHIEVDESAIDTLTRLAYQPEYGARPVKRIIDNYLLDPLATKMLSGDVSREQPIRITAPADVITII